MNKDTNIQAVYQSIIDDVIKQVKSDFEKEGISESLLEELKQLWEQKLAESGAVAPPKNIPRQEIGDTTAGEVVYDLLSGEEGYDEVQTQYRHQQVQQPSQQQHLQHRQILQPQSVTSQQQQYNQQLQHHLPLSQVQQQQQQRTAYHPQQYNHSFATNMYMPYQPTTLDMYGVGKPQPYLPPVQRSPWVDTTGPSVNLSISSPFVSSPQVASPFPISALSPMPATPVQSNDEREQKRARTTHNGNIPQVDGAGGRPSLDELSDMREFEEDDDNDDDNDLNSEDDDENDEQEPDTDHLVLAQFEKVQRTKNKWKVNLKSGIMHLNGTDYLFNKANGEFDW